jgi:hypothetical protein
MNDNARTEGEMKTAFEDFLAATKQIPGAGIAAQALTISAGTATPAGGAGGILSIDTEAAAASDDLTNLAQTNCPDGSIVWVHSANNSRDVAVKHSAGGAGQISLRSGADLVLDTTTVWLCLRRNGTVWEELTRSGNDYAVTPTVIAVSSSSAALRVTQTGAGNALLVEDSANPDSTPFVIDAAGYVVAGHTARLEIDGATSLLQSHGTTGARLGTTRWTNDQYGPIWQALKSRGTAITTRGIVQADDSLWEMNIYGDDGVSDIAAARIVAFVDGTPGVNDMPTRLTFYTTADGSATAQERMRINAHGGVGIGTTGAAGRRLSVGGNHTGAVGAYGILSAGTVMSDVTTGHYGVATSLSTEASPFTVTSLIHFIAQQGTLGASSTVTNQYGFYAAASMVNAGTNYGFYSNLPPGSGKWNFYAADTAHNLFAGSTIIGTAAIATNATDGFLYIPTCAGAATGTPTAYTGRAAMVMDTTNNRLYLYDPVDAGWKYAALT